MSEEKDAAAVEYREFPDCPGYRIGSDGSGWKAKHFNLKVPRSNRPPHWRPLKGGITSRGYRAFKAIDRTGKRRVFSAHTLVLTCFVGPRPEGLDACHNNGDQRDNRVENLRWDTPVANANDKRIHGTLLFGVDHGRAVLDETKVIEARKLRAVGAPWRFLASRYSVEMRTIQHAVKGETWKHVEEGLPYVGPAVRAHRFRPWQPIEHLP